MSRKEWIVLSCLGALVFLMIVGLAGFLIHPSCQKDCNAQPAYYYWMVIPHTTYSHYYGTDDEGHPLPSHTSPSEEEPGSSEYHSQPSEEEPPEEEVPHISEP
jgi:hypothetical protein